MSDQPPKGPGFNTAPGGPADPPAGPNTIAHKSEEERLAKLRADLKGMLAVQGDKQRGRAQSFYPYILIRSLVGDRGDRPINVPFWESPDIWTYTAAPDAAPAVPPDHGGVVTAGVPNTLYAHVWNLGRAPIAGVKVEFYWFNPSLGIVGANANLIGMVRVDLGPRSSPTCHKLVKCPRAWVPSVVNGGHECLVVRASAIGDYLNPAHEWDSWADRHVAQRNIHVALAQADMQRLLTSLEATRPAQTRTQLLQVGEHADIALRIAAPQLKLDTKVQTLVLAELEPDGSLHLSPTAAGTPGGMAPVKPAVAPAAVTVLGAARINPAALLAVKAAPAPPATAPQQTYVLAQSGANLQTLVGHFNLISPEVLKEVQLLKPPVKGEAQVLRIVSYRGDQMVGGYTVIVQGA